MAALDDARTALADAVTGAGLECLPYAPDTLSAPLAFVDEVALNFESGFAGGSFCLPAQATAAIVMTAQRHDRPGSTQYLETLLTDVLDALHAIPGVRVTAATSGSLSIDGQGIPATTIAVQFAI